MKTTYQDKYKALVKEVEQKIVDLIKTKGEESKFNNERVLKIKDKQAFNLDNGRWLTEIIKDAFSISIADNHGYTYDSSVLTLDQLCEIVDSF